MTGILQIPPGSVLPARAGMESGRGSKSRGTRRKRRIRTQPDSLQRLTESGEGSWGLWGTHGRASRVTRTRRVGRRGDVAGLYGSTRRSRGGYDALGRPAIASDCRPHHPRGFSLVELIVVIAIALVLSGLLMPALSQVRENAHRVVCSSNQRQIGIGFVTFHDQNNDRLPMSFAMQPGSEQNDPRDLMRATDGENNWDGLGLLFAGGYCRTPECFYCPSHHGNHPIDEYLAKWVARDPAGTAKVYTNYHYAGHIEWNDPWRPRRLTEGDRLVLLTDGLQSASDFNHHVGMNVLRGDGSVRWWEDREGVADSLPSDGALEAPPDGYQGLWRLISTP